MEITTYLDAADVAFDEMLEIIEKQMEANEQRQTFNQPTLPYVIDLRAELEKTKEKALQVHAAATRYGRDTHGTAAEWSDKAIMRFRDSLLQMVHRPEGNSALKDYLQSQIYDLWPELVPPRNLTSEEVTELCELQSQSESILESLRQTANEAIEGLWAISTAEQTLISGTSSNNQRLINDRTRCELAALAGIISTAWDRQAGNLVEPVAQITKYYMSAAPRRWEDKRK